MLKKYELSVQDHIKLIDYCKTQKIKFLSSPFDTDSLKILFNLGVKNIKIASGEITHYPLLRDIANDPIKKNNCIAIARRLDMEFKKLKQEYKNKIII